MTKVMIHILPNSLLQIVPISGIWRTQYLIHPKTRELSLSQVFRAQAGMAGDAGEHPGTDFFAVVKRIDDVRPAFALQDPVRSALPLDLLPDTLQGSENAAGPSRSPPTHAATKSSLTSVTVSPCSNRSASVRKASASTFARASCCVAPYVMTPGNAGISAIQRPSSSCSNSIRITSASPFVYRTYLYHGIDLRSRKKRPEGPSPGSAATETIVPVENNGRARLARLDQLKVIGINHLFAGRLLYVRVRRQLRRLEMRSRDGRHCGKRSRAGRDRRHPRR